MAATAPSGSPTSVAFALNYLELFTRSPDLLEGSYSAALFARHASTSGLNSDQLRALISESPEESLKVFLAHIMDEGGDARIICVFRPTKFCDSLRNPSTKWAGKYLLFGDDIFGSENINVYKVPDDAFGLADEVVIPTVAGMQPAIEAAGAGVDWLEPIPEGTPNTEKATVRPLCPVPHFLIGTFLAQEIAPFNAWAIASAAVVDKGLEVDCRYLLAWLRVACVKTPNPDVGDETLAPANFLGGRDGAFPVLRMDAALNDFVKTNIGQDLPALGRRDFGGSDATLALIKEVREERKEAEERAVAREALASAPKTVSEVFPLTVSKWALFAGVSDERQLPELFADWARCKKHERRLAFSDRARDRSMMAGAATNLAPVISKEMQETLFSGNLAPADIELARLELGIHPLTFGFFPGDPTSELVKGKAIEWDQFTSGTVAGTPEGMACYDTKVVPFTNRPFVFDLQVRTCSVNLDACQEIRSPGATALRNFCAADLPKIVRLLHQIKIEEPYLLDSVIPRLQVWFATRMNTYHDGLVNQRLEAGAALPNYASLYPLMALRDFDKLPGVPVKYLKLLEGARVPSPTPQPVPAEEPVVDNSKTDTGGKTKTNTRLGWKNTKNPAKS